MCGKKLLFYIFSCILSGKELTLKKCMKINQPSLENKHLCLQTDSSATIDLGHGRVITVHPAILEHLHEEPCLGENINER